MLLLSDLKLLQQQKACLAGEVSSLASRADLASIAERPDVMQRVIALLECLRGAAQGTSPDAQQPLFSVYAGVMEPLLALQKAYRQHEPVVCLLLKLAGDVVEAHVSYLPVSASCVKSQRGGRTKDVQLLFAFGFLLLCVSSERRF